MDATIQFTCPHCSHQIQLPSSTVGKQGKCPGCGQVVTITAGAAQMPPVNPAAQMPPVNPAAQMRPVNPAAQNQPVLVKPVDSPPTIPSSAPVVNPPEQVNSGDSPSAKLGQVVTGLQQQSRRTLGKKVNGWVIGGISAAAILLLVSAMIVFGTKRGKGVLSGETGQKRQNEQVKPEPGTGYVVPDKIENFPPRFSTPYTLQKIVEEIDGLGFREKSEFEKTDDYEKEMKSIWPNAKLFGQPANSRFVYVLKVWYDQFTYDADKEEIKLAVRQAGNEEEDDGTDYQLANLPYPTTFREGKQSGLTWNCDPAKAKDILPQLRAALVLRFGLRSDPANITFLSSQDMSSYCPVTKEFYSYDATTADLLGYSGKWENSLWVEELSELIVFRYDTGEIVRRINFGDELRIANEKRIAEEKKRIAEEKRIAAEQERIFAQTPITNSIGMDLKLLPAGSFQMGSKVPLEMPVYEVTLSQPFYMGVYEVTQAQYAKVMGENPSEFKSSQNPVGKISWDDAVEFCRKLSALPVEKAAGRVYQLPTEAQWEFACRAGTTTQFSFGDDESKLGEYAWYRDNSNDTTHPVGQKQANPWGLYDMHGNVWEWCSDWNGNYPSGNATDPTGPNSEFRRRGRVIRGGSWIVIPEYCRSAFRAYGDPSARLGYGFRVACVPSSP